MVAAMTSGDVGQRDLVTLVVDSIGTVVETDVLWEPYRLIDPGGAAVTPVTEFLQELQASGRSPSTQRSYALDLLRWFRFLWAVEVPWAEATRCEARDFCRWLGLVDKPRRGVGPLRAAGAANPVTGKRSPGRKYAASTLAHSETVLRSFYAFHLEVGSGPIINPFPLVRERSGSRPRPTPNGSWSSAPNWPMSWPPSSTASADPATRWLAWPPTTPTSGSGTRPCRYCFNASSGWAIGPSPLERSVTGSASR